MNFLAEMLDNIENRLCLVAVTGIWRDFDVVALFIFLLIDLLHCECKLYPLSIFKSVSAFVFL